MAVSAHHGRAACRGRVPCGKHAGDARKTGGATTSQRPPRCRGLRSPPAVLPSGRASATSSAVRHWRQRAHGNGDVMATRWQQARRCNGVGKGAAVASANMARAGELGGAMTADVSARAWMRDVGGGKRAAAMSASAAAQRLPTCWRERGGTTEAASAQILAPL